MIDCEIKISNWNKIYYDLPYYNKPGFDKDFALNYYKGLALNAIKEYDATYENIRIVVTDVINSVRDVFDLNEYPWGKNPEWIETLAKLFVNLGIDSNDILRMITWQEGIIELNGSISHCVMKEIYSYLTSDGAGVTCKDIEITKTCENNETEDEELSPFDIPPPSLRELLIQISNSLIRIENKLTLK